MNKGIKFGIIAFALFSYASTGTALAQTSGEEQMREFQMKQMMAENATFQLPAPQIRGKALVFVERQSNLGGLIGFDVFVDSKDRANQVGTTHAGKYIYFYLTPGEHKIYSNAENWAEISVNAKDGEVIYLTQEVHFGLFAASNSISRLDEVKGKNQLRTLGKGEVINDGADSSINVVSAPKPTPEPEKPIVVPAQEVPPQNAQASHTGSSSSDVGKKLKELHDIWKAGLITDQEYNTKKAELLKQL